MKRLIALGAALGAILLSPPADAERRTTRAHEARSEDLFDLHEIGGLIEANVVAAPNGEELAFFERRIDLGQNQYQHLLVVVDISTGAHRIIAEAGDIILASSRGRRSGAPFDRRPIWSADSQWVYYTALTARGAEIWRVRRDGAENRQIFAPPGDVRRFTLSADGDALIVETQTSRQAIEAQRDRDERDGFRVDEAFAPLYALRPLPDEDSGGEISRLSLIDGHVRPASADERARLNTPADLHVRQRDRQSRAYAPALGVFSESGEGELICLAAACSGALKESWRLASGNSERIVFRRLEGHAGFWTALYEWRPDRTASEREMNASEATSAGDNIRRIRRSADRLEGCILVENGLACLQDFATQPRRLVRIDIETGAERVLYDPNPAWRAVRTPRIERLDYTDSEGNQSFAQLIYPLNYRRGTTYPAVIVQYRARGFLNAGTGADTPIFPLSARGYFVLNVDRPEFDIRGARLSYHELARETELDDSENTIKRQAILWFLSELQRRHLVDQSRIAITGMSDGAETLFDMLLDGPSFRAAVASSPPGDPIAYVLQSRQFRQSRRNDIGFSPPWDQTGAFYAWWRENSPTLRNAPINTALMLNLSETEALRAFPLLAHQEGSSAPIESYLYPGAYHIKWRPAQIWATRERTLAWLDFWLRDVSPSDNDTRSRWQAMRQAWGASDDADEPSGGSGR
ncbi:Atxe2 family lasso peptide isopeptidase [Candidatus Viadribacter manganicus]|uniref:Peptidase S9 prolyl oligopeptidase catalytic domain-containing protein n=1 Tax=Candidatus Viadribacter manganicus TaxID=1759059 RepID=A0A1B1AH78_9PROT|nr:Atxe2 family lasso peptide isopeptidase [Candidatus Viadribacter manganicus]ANP45908.1 hypothetical protein ATE48_08225 [Candidatus Viadribacter manganicus]